MTSEHLAHPLPVEKQQDAEPQEAEFPVDEAEMASALAEAEQLEQELNAEPLKAPDDLAAAFGMDRTKVIELLELEHHAISFDAPVGKGEATFGEFVPTPDPVDPVVRKLGFKSGFERMLAILPERSAHVLRRYYGEERVTRLVIGEELGVGPSRVEQIEKAALKKTVGSFWRNCPARNVKLR